MESESLQIFQLGSENLYMTPQSRYLVKEGVTCQTFTVEGRPDLDVAIIEITPGGSTVAQRMIHGSRTIERLLSGEGVLRIIRSDGRVEIHSSNIDRDFEVEIAVGDTMQWKSIGDEPLVFAEICYPPYQEGRFKDLHFDLEM